MKGKRVKLTATVIAVILFSLILPLVTLAAGENIQIVHTNDKNYVVYIEGVNDEFDYALSNNANADEIDLDFVKSVVDEEENNVVLITESKYETIKDQTNYLYAKNSSGEIVKGKELNFADALEQSDMKNVETTSKRIKTEVADEIVMQDEEKDGIQYKTTVGGLRITDSENAKYFYATTKLPNAKYTELKELADKINDEYNEMSMFNRISIAKEFDELYKEIANTQTWREVKDMLITQPEDAKNDEQYVVFVKMVDENNTEIIDVEFMTSHRKDVESVIPAKTETKVVQETAKLPITGDSIILFAVLAGIIVVAIVVFVRMKKLQNKKSEK